MRSVPIQWDHWRSFIAVAEEGSLLISTEK